MFHVYSDNQGPLFNLIWQLSLGFVTTSKKVPDWRGSGHTRHDRSIGCRRWSAVGHFLILLSTSAKRSWCSTLRHLYLYWNGKTFCVLCQIECNLIFLTLTTVKFITIPSDEFFPCDKDFSIDFWMNSSMVVASLFRRKALYHTLTNSDRVGTSIPFFFCMWYWITLQMKEHRNWKILKWHKT